jgi:hypothetical protein
VRGALQVLGGGLLAGAAVVAAVAAAGTGWAVPLALAAMAYAVYMERRYAR